MNNVDSARYMADSEARQRDAKVRVHDENTPATTSEIDTAEKDLAEITPQVWEALQAANNPPTLFRYGGLASRIELDDGGETLIRSLDFHRMRYHCARAAKFVEWRKSGNDLVARYGPPPKDVVNDLLATPNHPFPILTRIVEAPVFGRDGSLQTTPGYHSSSQTYYAPANGFRLPVNVPADPTEQHIEVSRKIICYELLGDFPFVGESEIAHAVAVLLLPFARDLIDGPTPLHLFEKPSPGTGATLLIDMLSLPATGRPIPTMTEGRDEDEWRKRITAKLATGSAFLLIDNLRRRLDSAAVAAGITSTTWEDRLLGFSTMARLPVRCVWVATGNNPAVSTEIARRTVRIRMDAKLDRPWLRNGFRHENLRGWANQNRGLIVVAALTLIRAWILQGKPKGKTTLGMFERWSEVMGGILDVAGIPGFLGNLNEFYDESDAEGATWRTFLSAWWEQFGENEVTAKDLWLLATGDANLSLGNGSEQSQRCTLGKLLADRRDRIFEVQDDQGAFKLLLQRGSQRQRAYQWSVKQVEA
jgi:hypothetical protein